ncbi:MAG TPA: DUF922 domain-containing protein [Actinophytocola sp.]|jgi:hypothetical protein|uniref:DUF922 domain-containing protein n=1 Tax=Actinophytocola sp. TaxID=1872138 RepID=UPI002E0AAAB2|nr:DUF922 domain-containing protein [Actinophytocola sp.]
MRARDAELATAAGVRTPSNRPATVAEVTTAEQPARARPQRDQPAVDRASRANWAAALQRAVGNRAACHTIAAARLGEAVLQRQEDEATPALGDSAPIPLEGSEEQACPTGVTENVKTPSEVPIDVTADSPSQWLQEVSARLDDNVGHVQANRQVLWCIAADDKSVSGVSLNVSLTKKVARPVRGHGLSGAVNDAKWKLVQDMAKAINEHEDRHMEIYKTALTGLAQKLKDLKPPPGKKKLTDADIRKVYDDATCAAEKKQEELDAREGLIKVNPDEKGFTTSGEKHDYTTGCRSAATPAPTTTGGT